MPDNLSAYAMPTPGLYDMLGGFGRPPGTPEEELERKKQQEQQKQMMALGQRGLQMMQPQQPQTPPPQSLPVAPQQMPQQAPQPLPQATQVTPDQLPRPRQPIGYDPRDPRSRNPMAGMPHPFGGLYR